MSDLQDQLKSLFPDYQPTESPEEDTSDGVQQPIWLQSDPLICKYEKRKGKSITIIEGYDGADADFKALAKQIKQKLRVGGSFKNGTIIIQGDYRDQIMQILQKLGFKTKRVGG